MTDLVYAVIKSYIITHGYSPTLDEVAEAAGLQSANGAWYHVQKLVRDGRLVRPRFGSPRGLRVVR